MPIWPTVRGGPPETRARRARTMTDLTDFDGQSRKTSPDAKSKKDVHCLHVLRSLGEGGADLLSAAAG